MLFRRQDGWRRDCNDCTKHGYGGPGYGGFGRYGMYGGYRSHYNYATKWNPLPVPTGPPLITTRPPSARTTTQILKPFFNPLPRVIRVVPAQSPEFTPSTLAFFKWLCILMIITVTFWSTDCGTV